MQHERLGQHSAAERKFAKALKQRAGYFDALLHYGLFKYQQEQLPAALELLTKAAAANPLSIDALNNLGSVLFRLNRRRTRLWLSNGRWLLTRATYKPVIISVIGADMANLHRSP